MAEDKENTEDVGATVVMPVANPSDGEDSHAKDNRAEDNGATIIVPPKETAVAGDVGATQIVPPANEAPVYDASSTIIITPDAEPEGIGSTVIMEPQEATPAPIDSTVILSPSDEDDGSTKVMPAAEISSSKTGEMDAVPAQQASAFDVLLGKTDPIYHREFALKKNKFTIGRSPFNDIIIKSEAVSASHAEIERIKRKWVLRDVGSVNGIHVNGVFGGEGDEFDLSISDEIIIGDTVLQLCSPHTLEESKNTPVLSGRKSKSSVFIVGGIAIVVVIAVVVFLAL